MAFGGYYNYDETDLGALKENATQSIRVKRLSSNGELKAYDIRNYWRDDSDEDWKPTKKGVRLNEEALLLLIDMLQKDGFVMDSDLESSESSESESEDDEE